jgi:hypothetical protein
VSNSTYVCFDCRTTERVPIARISRACRKCRKPAHHVYYKFSIPKRDDNPGWKDLEAKVRPMNRKIYVTVMSRLRRDRAHLEQVLAETPVTRDARRRDLNRKLKINAKELQSWEQWSVA